MANEAIGRNPIGTGPYVHSRADSREGEVQVYTPNPTYWDKDKVGLTRYEVWEMPDDTARLNALKTGQIDAGNWLATPRSAIIEYVDVRTLLETYAASTAMPFHTAESIARVQQIQMRMEKAVQGGHTSKFRQMNRELHEAIYAPCPNAVLKATLVDLWDRVWRARSESIFDADPSRMVGAHTESLSAERREDHDGNED
jgi:hypothetical protein